MVTSVLRQWSRIKFSGSCVHVRLVLMTYPLMGDPELCHFHEHTQCMLGEG